MEDALSWIPKLEFRMDSFYCIFSMYQTLNIDFSEVSFRAASSTLIF